LADKARLLVEAGTGVGKSFAYLVPAMLRCIFNKERVVIATNTISLQEQLIQKDIPFLMSVIEEWLGGLKGIKRENLPLVVPALVKGRGNYVSIRRLRLASQRQHSLFSEQAAIRSLHVIEDWAGSTKEGTLATLPALEYGEVWDHVRSDADNCMGRKCEHFKECFFQTARREMETANLLVCNHALFFSDLSLKVRLGDTAGILPPHQHVVLDEAHNVEDVACEHFGISLTQARVARLLRTLYQARRGKGYLSERTLSMADADAVSRAIHLVGDAEHASREFFEALFSAWEKEPTKTGRIRERGIVENMLSPAMNSLCVHLKILRDLVKGEADKFELTSYAKRAGDIADAAAALVDQAVPESVYWIDVQSSGRTGGGGGGRTAVRGSPMTFPRVTFACSPIEAGPILREHLFSRQIGIILTSATLSTRAVKHDEHRERAETAFAYITAQLGCEGALTMQLGSPFDHARQVSLYVDTTMPAPGLESGQGGGRSRGPVRPPAREKPTSPFPGAPPSRSSGQQQGIDSETRRYVADDAASFDAFEDGAREEDISPPRTFIEELSSRILDHVKATDGGAFVLFTSFTDLFGAAEALAHPLELLDIQLLVQGRDGPRSQILERFRQNDRSVLFGAASFWQGVDVRGHGLRNVIITKLPFEPPDRPITQARIERIQARGGNPFMEESLPRAVIRFKQGFGRLVRSKTDTGRVVVLDPRILRSRYGARFLDALPDGIKVQTIE
ncbi:MAG: hypothetical protein H7210_00150, partial [Pyrinomonadaceae bacterium]|nr:hypothetical protein [Phycisphaerales bacterium]